jgi:thiol:disulfide interchange protein
MHILFSFICSMIRKLALGLTFLVLAFSAHAQIKFQKLNLEEAKKSAAIDNKLIFIDFRANWCKPCIEMERTTFMDKQVGTAINVRYIPITADVDFFNWMDAQEYYNVSVLPTILILDHNGVVQQRIIGQKTAFSLMDELNIPYNGKETEIDPVVVDVTDKSKESDLDASKPCFLKRWFKK